MVETGRSAAAGRRRGQRGRGWEEQGKVRGGSGAPDGGEADGEEKKEGHGRRTGAG